MDDRSLETSVSRPLPVIPEVEQPDENLRLWSAENSQVITILLPAHLETT